MARLSKLSRSVKGSVVHVTGAASGMGRATAILFADEGAKVAVTDRDQEKAEAVAKEINDAGGIAKAWALDVCDAERIIEVTNAIGAEFGGLDILVNNAGLGVFVKLDSEKYEERWQFGMDVLINSVQRIVRASLPMLRKAEHGRIINIASTEGLGATENAGPYTAAKHAVVGFTKSLAVDLGREGITANCVCPGPIKTPLTDFISDEHKVTFAKRRVAVRRYGDPEEVAHATFNFALPSASFMTGVIMPVDGGLWIRNA
ncbi:MAG: SDR family NAD(P)-dependent oxidoreductase [Porticoccaceae bacterium]|nr:SDR family NAD(P)-dependent oxidoreductase [Porticoccaceae bacterium]